MTTDQDTVDRRWRALALRLAVLTLPAQMVGALVGFVPTLLLGRAVLDLPWVPSLVLVGVGAVTGLGVGRFAHPPEGHRGAAVALAAGYGLAGFAVLGLLVQLRTPAGSAPSLLSWSIGALVVVALQSVVVALLWRRRARP